MKENISMSVDFDEDRIKQSIDKSGLGKKLKIFQMEVRHIFPENLMKMELSFQEGKGKSLPLHVQFIEILQLLYLMNRQQR